MELHIAGPQDEQDLKDFYESFTVNNLADFKVSRPISFFASYQTQSDEHITYILKDHLQKQIMGMASFVIRSGLYENQVVRFAYATDLRVSQQRKAILNWVQYFIPVLKEVREKYNVSYIFSTINMTDLTALNTFVRPRPLRRPLPRYFLYRRFFQYTVHGRFPWAPSPLSTIRIRTANEKTEAHLIEYLIKRNKYRPFASVWDQKSFHLKLSHLKGLKLEHFHLAYDSNDKVVGCVAPWTSKGIQEYLPLSYSLPAHNFRQFLKFGRAFGLTRNLTKPKISTGLEAPMNFHYLTHLHADNEDILESLLWTAYEAVPKTDFLVYSACEADYRLKPPEAWVTAEIPYSLYCIVSPDEEKPLFLDASNPLNPEIESCWV